MPFYVSAKGSLYDFDAMPDHSHDSHKPGKHDPDSGEPIDRKAVEAATFAFGGDQGAKTLKEAMLARCDRLEAWLAKAKPTDKFRISGSAAYAFTADGHKEI